MKRKFLVTGMMLMAILLSACQTTQQTDSRTAVAYQSHIDRILAVGELRVGTSASQPPLNMKDRDGHIFWTGG